VSKYPCLRTWPAPRGDVHPRAGAVRVSGVPGIAITAGRLFLGGGIGIVRGIGGWLGKRSFAEIALIAVVAASLVIHLAEVHRLHKAEGQLLATSNALRKERLAHAADIARWKVGQAQADALAKANVARVTAEQKTIADERTKSYESRIADARARADRLRGASSIHQGTADATGMPGVPAAPGLGQASGQGGLSAGDALIATEQAIELDELIKEWRKQSAIDPNKP
jgi:hypothetical protein